MDRDPSDTPESAVREFEADLGLPAGFYMNLLEQDDWSFVIKLHALLEGAIAHVLVEVIGKPELADVVGRLGMAGATGRLAFAEALSCTSREDVRFARELGQIRNKFAHDVHHVTMTLEEHVNGLDANRFNAFRQAFGPGQDPYPIAGKLVSEAVFVRENPKVCIWIAGLYVLAIAYHEKRVATAWREASRSMLASYSLLSAIRSGGA